MSSGEGVGVRSTVGRYSTSLPDMQNTHNILTNIGHRFGHQSGLYESSGLNSTSFLFGFALHVYLVFSQIGKNITY